MEQIKKELEANISKIADAIKEGYRIELKNSKDGLQVIQLNTKKIN